MKFRTFTRHFTMSTLILTGVVVQRIISQKTGQDMIVVQEIMLILAAFYFFLFVLVPGLLTGGLLLSSAEEREKVEGHPLGRLFLIKD